MPDTLQTISVRTPWVTSTWNFLSLGPKALVHAKLTLQNSSPRCPPGSLHCFLPVFLQSFPSQEVLCNHTTHSRPFPTHPTTAYSFPGSHFLSCSYPFLTYIYFTYLAYWFSLSHPPIHLSIHWNAKLQEGRDIFAFIFCSYSPKTSSGTW